MEINNTDFNVKEERLFNGVIRYICTPKERKCDNDGCNNTVRFDKLNFIKFSTVKDKQRYTIDAMVCNSCYPQIKEWIDNNPYRRRVN